MITTVNPTTGDRLAEYPELDDAGLEDSLERAARAFEPHRETSVAERSARLRVLGDVLARDATAHAELMTREMGKPLKQAIAEARKCAEACRYYADHAADFLADEPRESPARKSVVAYAPLGPVLAVMPWNFPYWQVFRFAAPAMAAGNVALLKHASNVLGCGNAIESLFREAGFDDGVFQHLVVSADRVAAIIQDRRVAAVTLTGSEGAGRSVAAAAAGALKKSVLELGGSDAFIVLADADLEHAASTAVRARVQNNGQSCIAAKRFIVEEAVADAFTDMFVVGMANLVVGDPMSPDTDVGPLARSDLRDEVRDQVQRSVAAGAVVLTGGEIPTGAGFFYPPTVLGGVRAGMAAFEEEIFGPVAAVTVARDADDAIRLANSSRFGLGGSVFTRDTDRGERIARQLQCGSAFVNAMVRSHSSLPFGGIKASGYGRELGPEGLREFVNVQTVWVE